MNLWINPIYSSTSSLFFHHNYFISTSPDLKRCTIYVSSLENAKGTLSKALDKNRVKIQKELGRQLTTKFIPRIQFEIDFSFDNADKINELIYKINEK